MYSTTENPIIWTKELVYTSSCSGKLGKRFKVGETLIKFQHQSRFDSNTQRGFPITIHNHTTFTVFIDRIGRRVSFIKCTVLGTSLRRVVNINWLKRNTILEGITFNKLYELSIRDSVYVFICLSIHSRFSTTNTEFFKSDRGIVFISKVYNLSSNLTVSGLNEVYLFMFNYSQVFFSILRTSISMTSKLCNLSFILSLPVRNIPAKIKLFNYYGLSGTINCYSSESRRANINTYTVPFIISNFWIFFFNTNSNLSIKKGNNFNILHCFQLLFKSLIAPINPDRNNKLFTRRVGKSIFDSFSFSQNIFTRFLDNIRWKEGGFTYV